MTAHIAWKCPNCRQDNDDEIDDVYGPFITCTCGNCGKSFDQDKVIEQSDHR